MIVQNLAFYLFAVILVASAVMVITARNPVHSVLFLILAFFILLFTVTQMFLTRRSHS